MAEATQKSIEQFFEQYGVTNPDQKAKLLSELTDVIYEYNMSIVKLETEQDEYHRQQIQKEIQEVENKIKGIIEDETGTKNE